MLRPHRVVAKPFFDLQIGFARKAARLAAGSIEEALLDYTNLYARFGLGREFDAAHPVWQAFVQGLERADNGEIERWTYRFYRSRLPEPGPPDVVASIGCFSYARLGDQRLRLHFSNADDRGPSLSVDRQTQRLDELRRLFELAAAREDAASTVVGASWLYHLPAYRRLFPQAHLATAVVVTGAFRAMPLWGQFIDRHGRLHPGVETAFQRRLDEVEGIDDLGACFPLSVLRLESPLGVIRKHYPG